MGGYIAFSMAMNTLANQTIVGGTVPGSFVTMAAVKVNMCANIFTTTIRLGAKANRLVIGRITDEQCSFPQRPCGREGSSLHVLVKLTPGHSGNHVFILCGS